MIALLCHERFAFYDIIGHARFRRLAKKSRGTEMIITALRVSPINENRLLAVIIS
jgi:hypothetical protein